jgi:hypothetical protein
MELSLLRTQRSHSVSKILNINYTKQRRTRVARSWIINVSIRFIAILRVLNEWRRIIWRLAAQ